MYIKSLGHYICFKIRSYKLMIDSDWLHPQNFSYPYFKFIYIKVHLGM